MSDDLLSQRLEYFAERLNLVFSYFLCTLEFENDKNFIGDPGKSDRTWFLQTIQNACLQTTLIALRDLDDFLNQQKSKPDDLRVSDFGFQKDLRFLTRDERERINKHVAHITHIGATSHPFRWDVLELTSKCVSQCLEFLKWMESSHSPDEFMTWTAAIFCRKKTEAIFNYLTQEVEKRRK